MYDFVLNFTIFIFVLWVVVSLYWFNVENLYNLLDKRDIKLGIIKSIDYNFDKNLNVARKISFFAVVFEVALALLIYFCLMKL